MDIISAEKLIEQMQITIYPITLVKLLLNRSKILSNIDNAKRHNFEIRGIKYKVDSSSCKMCEQKREEKMLCRQHTSIQRVLHPAKDDVIAYDVDTELYLYKNEIFKMATDNRLVIVYCPHPKLILGQLTDSKVRKITTITIEDDNIKEPMMKYKTTPIKIRKISSSELMNKHIKCWFNNTFSIITIPESMNNTDVCFILN